MITRSSCRRVAAFVAWSVLLVGLAGVCAAGSGGGTTGRTAEHRRSGGR